MKKFSFKKVAIKLGLDDNPKLYKAGIRYGSDKLTHHGYERFYGDFLDGFRSKDINFFEIGIDTGSSLKMWNRYFSRARVYGMDIGHEYVHPRGKIFKGDQSKLVDLRKITQEIKNSDIIIDDGSHVPEHQLLTFNYLFKNMLNYGGVYIIEDIETSYWSKAELYGYKIDAGYNKNNNIVNIFKIITDIVNREFLTPDDIKTMKAAKLVDYDNLKHISFIMFGHNCIIIKKMTKAELSKYTKRKYRFLDKLKSK